VKRPPLRVQVDVAAEVDAAVAVAVQQLIRPPAAPV